MDNTILDQTIDAENDAAKPSKPSNLSGWQAFKSKGEEKDTSSKIFNKSKAKWGDQVDNDHSDFKFAPEVGNNDLTEKEQMSRAYKEMSAAQMEVFSA